MSIHNHLIPYEAIPDDTKKNYYNNFLTMRKKDFDQNKLEMTK